MEDGNKLCLHTVFTMQDIRPLSKPINIAPDYKCPQLDGTEDQIFFTYFYTDQLKS